MHIDLYQALKTINVDDEKAAATVAALESYIAMKIKESTAGMEAKLAAQNWLLGFIGVLLAIISLGPVVAKLL